MERVHLSYPELFCGIICCVVFLLITSRVFYAISAIAKNGFSARLFWNDLIHGGIVFYGGMIGVLIGGVVFALVRHRNIRETLDYIAPSIPLFHIFGRIGCAFAGCCYGYECSWGIINTKFPGVTFFPVQLIESGCNLLILIVILIVQRIRKTDRYSIEMYLIGYSVCRFILEFCRGDMGRGIWPDGLSTSQHIALIIIVITIVELLSLAIRSGGLSARKNC